MLHKRVGVVALAFALTACASSPNPGGTASRTATTTHSGAPNWRAAPTYGTVELSAGFMPDPYLRSISAGGGDAVELGGPGCTGYIHAAAPDLDLNYRAGGYQLAIYAKSDSDVTLVVNAADGRWYCSDDFHGTDPAIVFDNPPAGQYNIWVGTYGPSSRPLPEAVIYISEMEPRW